MNGMSESLENKAFAFDPLLSPFSSLEPENDDQKFSTFLKVGEEKVHVKGRREGQKRGFLKIVLSSSAGLGPCKLQIFDLKENEQPHYPNRANI